MIDRGIHTSHLKNVTYIFHRIKKKVHVHWKKADTLINDGAYSGQFFPPSLKGNNTPPALKTFDPKSDLFVTDLHAWTY